MKSTKPITLLLASLSLTSSIYANPIKDVVDTLSSLNNKEKVDCSKMSNDEVAALCVEEVCGDPNKNPVIVTKETVDKFNTDEVRKKMDEAEATIRQREKEVSAYMNFISEEQNKLKNLKDPNAIKDEDARDILKEIITDIKREHKLLQLANLGKSKDNTIKLKVPKKSPYYEVYQDIISKISIDENLEFAIKAKVSPDNETQYKIYLAKAVQYQEEAKARGLTPTYDFVRAIESAEKTNKKYIDALYVDMLHSARSLGISLEKPVCNQECKQSLITYLKKAPYFSPTKIVAEEQKKFGIEDSIAECRAAIAFNNIKAKDSQEIEKEWPKLIERLKDNTSLKFSDHSKGIILNKIEKDLTVMFNVPPMNNHIDPLAGSIRELETPAGTLAESYNLATNEVYYSVATQTPRCTKINKAATINDMVMYEPSQNNGTLVVSPYSCEHAHLGKEIMAHELGHAVSYMIALTPEMSTETKANFKSLRECSRQDKRTTKFPGLISPHEGDKWTTEEDTADLFSFALSKDKENFMGCALVIPNGEEYQGLNMRKSFFDTHSSGIQRLMVELQYKNPSKITEACGEVIKRSKAKITNKCI